MRILQAQLSRVLFLRPFLLGLLLIFASFTATATVVELSIQGPIGPATADYISRGIANAEASSFVLINMDTPGGLDKSMRAIVQSMLTAKVPVVVYVAPNGARAASAGTFILYASSVACMAPGTHLGAASPVNLMAEDKAPEKKSTMDIKVMNDAIAYIKMLAELRGRNVDFAQKAVRDGSTMTASEAKKADVIEIVAQDRTDLMRQLNGLNVSQDGRQFKLVADDEIIQQINPDWRTRFLQVITDPTIAYLLMLLGLYGIFFELFNPGFIFPGVIGAIAIVLALYALHMLPINYAGLALIVLGILFIIAEAFAPSFGSLGLGGTVAFILGSIMLIDSEHQGFQIALSAIVAMAVANIAVLFMLMNMAIKVRREPVQNGLITLIGEVGRSLDPINPSGQAVINGEIWSVHSNEPIAKGQSLRVIKAHGLILEVQEIKGE